MTQKTCTRCGIVADEDMFRRAGRSGRKLCIRSFHDICIGCEQTDRDADKAVDPWIAKARWTIAHHAKKYGFSYAEFKRRFGWTEWRVAHMLQHAYENTCNYCWKPYSEMRNGLADVTLDIIDPAKLPDICTNVQPCCRTCNQEKSDMSPETFGRRLAFWRNYAEHMKHLKTIPTWKQMPLWQQEVQI